MNVEYFNPTLSGRDNSVGAFLTHTELDPAQPIRVSAKILDRMVRFSVSQGDKTYRYFTGRLRAESPPDDPTLERLACLKIMTDALVNSGFLDVQTDSPVVTQKAID